MVLPICCSQQNNVFCYIFADDSNHYSTPITSIKQRKRCKTDRVDLINFAILDELKSNLPKPKVVDEYESFGKMLSQRLRKTNAHKSALIMDKTNCLLYKVEYESVIF